MTRDGGTRARNVAAVAAGFSTFVNLYAPQSLLPTLADAFQTNAAQTGLAITATLVAVAAVAPFVGGISDALGRRRLVLPAAFALAVPTGLAGLAPSLPWFLLARFAQGLLLPFIFTVFVAYIADECRGAEGLRTTGLYAIGTIVGGFAGRFIAGWTAHFLDWRAAFFLLAGLTFAAALIVSAAMPAERQFRPVRGWRGTASGFASQLRNAQVLITCGVGFAVLFSIVATFTFANLLLGAPPYNLGPAGLGSIFVTYLLGAVATPSATRLTARFGRRWAMLGAGSVALAGLLLTLAPSSVPIVAGLALVALGVLTEQIISIGYVAIAGEQARSTAVGLYVTAYYVGGSLGGIAPAAIWSHAGWPGCVALVLAVQCAAVATTWLFWPRLAGLPTPDRSNVLPSRSGDPTA